jgi:hypothetical protein
MPAVGTKSCVTQQQSARVRLFRGRTRSPLGCEAAEPGRGAADRRQTSQSCRRVVAKTDPVRAPLTHSRPAGRRFAGSPDPRRGGRPLNPVGSRFPRRSEREESISVFRIARRLGPGQALTPVSAVFLRGHGHTDHPSTGRCKAKWGSASEQNCTPPVRYTRCLRPSALGEQSP